MSRSNELMEKAVQLQKLLTEVRGLASENDYALKINGSEFNDDAFELEFDDWMSSSCYGEGDDGFGVYENGTLWQSSSC